MANLAQSDANWLRFLREFFFFLRLGRTALEQQRRYTRERVQIKNEGDYASATPHITAITLTGVEYGQNTTEEGTIIVEFVANSSNWDVNLYDNPSGTLIGKATNVAASATGSIVAQNSSGLSGSVTLGATITGDTSENHRLRVEIDWKLELLKLWPSDGTTEEDTNSRSVATRLLATLYQLERQKEAAIIAATQEWALTAADNLVARGNSWTGEQDTALIAEAVRRDSAGAITRLRTGFLETLRAAMEDEGTGSEQDVIKRVVAGGAGSFSGNNTGAGAVASHTAEDHCPIGTWSFKCVAGLGSGAGGREQFECVFLSSDGLETFTGGALLTVKQAWKGPRGFGAITLTRTLSKTGDGSNVNVGAASTFSTTGESEANTDSGVLYLRTDANGSNWDFSFYRASGRNAGDLVAKAENVATGASGVQATARNGSGLTVTFTVGSAPVDTTANYSIDLAFFTVQNASNVPDKFTVATTLTSEGVISRIMGLLYDYKLNGDTSGSEQIDDDIARANVGLHYITDDV